MLKVILFIGSSIVLAASALQAGEIFSDSFNYPDGVLQMVSSNKWVGHSGTTNQADIYHSALALTGSESQDVNSTFPGQPYSTTNTVALFASFNVRYSAPPSSAGSYFAHFKDAGSGFRARIWALTNGAAAGSFRLGISSVSGTAPNAIHSRDLKTGAVFKVVSRLVLSNSVATLWIDPTGESDSGVSSDSGAAIAITSYAFRQASGIGTLSVSNLIVGMKFTDVVKPSQPPPSNSSEPSAQPPPPVIHLPIFTSQPESQTVNAGATVTFRAEARGEDFLSYQWRFDDREILGATNATLVLANVTPIQQGDYRLVVTGSSGIASTATVRLTVIGLEAPKITSQPFDLTLRSGETAYFFVSANGSAPINYQWRFNGKDLAEAKSSTLILSNATAAMAGQYDVKVSNASGAVVSDAATLKVESPTVKIAFTNYLDRLVCRGDLLTNQFSEHALRLGEKLTMQVRASGSDGQLLSLAPNFIGLPSSAQWTLGDNLDSSSDAIFTIVPSAADQGSNIVVALNLIKGAITTTSRWTIYVPTEQEQKVAITEFLANPATSSNSPQFNPLQRAEPAPNPSWNDEFIELVNTGDSDVDLSNWTISDSTQVRHRFPQPFILQAMGAIVVYGGPRSGYEPVLKGPAVWTNESETGFGLNNSGGDVILLRNAKGNLISRIVYSAISSNSSMTRYPTVNDDFVPHSSVSPSFSSPGLNYDGRKFSEPIPTEQRAITVMATLEASTSLLLNWNAEKGRTYSIYYAADLNESFAPIATGLKFPDDRGRYSPSDPRTGQTGFYRVATP